MGIENEKCIPIPASFSKYCTRFNLSFGSWEVIMVVDIGIGVDLIKEAVAITVCFEVNSIYIDIVSDYIII